METACSLLGLRTSPEHDWKMLPVRPCRSFEGFWHLQKLVSIGGLGMDHRLILKARFNNIKTPQWCGS